MRHFNTTFTMFFFLLLWAVTTRSQVSFTDQTSLLQSPAAFNSGVAVAIADMNGDGLDDVVRLNKASMLNIEYQAVQGQPFAHYEYGSISGDAWAIAVGDVNNDGFCDIFAGGFYNGVKVFTAIDNGATYEQQVLPGPGIFVQGANFADINNDGWLDVFSCHDDGESRIWGNDGNGGFIMADDWIDMATVPQSDNSGNYGSVWSDFDNDGDLDLYIAKCRQGVDDPEDPRRINALFVNDGQNNYHEAAEEHGLKIKWQSWTADFQDIDNDGDMDCLVTNHDYNLQLLENDGRGHFTDISASAGVAVNGGFIQGIMRDFDNDGFMDIITAGPTYLFHNNGDKTFTQVPNPFGSSFGTLTAGDLNHDGYLDLYTAYQNSYNTPSNTPDKLWMNNGGDHHFLNVSLQGTESNRMGVGARIEIHGEWGIQVREVRAGESYGIMNAPGQNFGLGQDTVIEYLVVRWPSGIVDVVKNPAADQFLTLEEGTTCTLPEFDLEASGPLVFCPGEALEISAPAGYDYLWNNGSVSQTITVNSSSNYSVIIVDGQGCAAVSNVAMVEESPDETPSLLLAGEEDFCQGGSVVLTASEAASYLWSTGDTTESITVTQTGDYFVTVPGACNDFTSETIHLEVQPAPAPLAEGLTIFAPAAVVLEANGNNPSWYDSINATVPLAAGTFFETPVITETTTFYVEDLYEYGGGNYEAGMAEVQYNNTPYSGNAFNGQTIFDVFQPLILKQVTVRTDSAGIRVIQLLNPAEDVLQSDTFDLPAGETVVDLGFYIEPGAGYRLATSTDMNQATLGTNSPRLQRSNQGVTYPYETPDVLSITGSSQGQSFYYYFFDWQVELPSLNCVSERIPVTVTLVTSGAEEVKPFGRLSVQPNPSTGLFALDLEALESSMTDLTVVDLTGRVVLAEKFEVVKNVRQLRQLNLGEYPAGLYFLKMSTGEGVSSLKLGLRR